ncbi:hypothetical protein [Pseudomonas sp.]|uniref:hypothetical protein n=1 Tax=Pseudomonas sp. TaxID=306 RepID=UPI003FD76C9E
MKNNQDNTGALSALLRTANGVYTLETKSLCCEAAGIITLPAPLPKHLYPTKSCAGQRSLMQR